MENILCEQLQLTALRNIKVKRFQVVKLVGECKQAEYFLGKPFLETILTIIQILRLIWIGFFA